MNEMEKTATTEWSVTPTIDEKTALTELTFTMPLKVLMSASGSENWDSGIEKKVRR